MNLIIPPRLTGAPLSGTVPAARFRGQSAGSKRRKYERMVISVIRRGTVLVMVALLTLIFFAARGSRVGT